MKKTTGAEVIQTGKPALFLVGVNAIDSLSGLLMCLGFPEPKKGQTYVISVATAEES
jgi:hypothetical protein